jgi:hypothetical protein
MLFTFLAPQRGRMKVSIMPRSLRQDRFAFACCSYSCNSSAIVGAALVDEAAQLGRAGPRLFRIPSRESADHHAALVAGDDVILEYNLFS